MNTKTSLDHVNDAFAALAAAITLGNEQADARRVDRVNLLLTLGAGPGTKRRTWGCRNCFVAGPMLSGSLNRLVDAGLCVRHEIFPDSTQGLRYYSATAAGCAAAGLSDAATRRALSRAISS